MPRAYNKPEFGPCAPVAAALLTDWGRTFLLCVDRLSRSNGNHANNAARTPHVEDRVVIVHNSGQMFAAPKVSRHDSRLDDPLRGGSWEGKAPRSFGGTKRL